MQYILEVPGYTNIVYIGVYLVLGEIERLFATVSYFLSFFCRSAVFKKQCKYYNTGNSFVSV